MATAASLCCSFHKNSSIAASSSSLWDTYISTPFSRRVRCFIGFTDPGGVTECFFCFVFCFFQELVISHWCSSRGSPSSCRPTPTTRRCPPRWPQPGLSTRSEASRSSWAKRPTAQVGVRPRSHKPFSHRQVALLTQRWFTNSPPLVVHTKGFSNEIYSSLYMIYRHNFVMCLNLVKWCCFITFSLTALRYPHLRDPCQKHDYVEIININKYIANRFVCSLTSLLAVWGFNSISNSMHRLKKQFWANTDVYFKIIF